MAEIGKHAAGLTGFPTPNEAAGLAGYLLLLFPDKEWAQYALGALDLLTVAYNWYEAGDLDTEEAAEAFRVIVQEAPYNTRSCQNPAGGKILRVAPNGHVQQLSDASEWEDPDGDYTIPPVPARTEGTPPDQICLAAKNAAHVLEVLYENVTDSFNDGLDQTEAATALTLTLIGLIGAEFAPITFALVTFFAIVFGVLYGLLEFIGADLWDTAFTNTIVCILQDCATNVDGVVTFDYDCFNNALAAQVNDFGLLFEQLRLFGQIQYLLLVIGGVDALNAAGATTAITDDDCSMCVEDHCFEIFLTEEDGSAHGLTMQGGTWVDGEGWYGNNYGVDNISDLFGYWQFPEVTTATVIEIEYYKPNGSGANDVTHFNYLYPTATGYSTVQIYQDPTNSISATKITRTYEPNQLLAGFGWDINSGASAGQIQMVKLTIRYSGDEIFGGDTC